MLMMIINSTEEVALNTEVDINLVLLSYFDS